MDGLSQMLSDAKISCCVHGLFVNHLMYTDDSCIIPPSPTGLRKLVDICSVYADANTIVFNELKTICMCFKTKSLCHDVSYLYLHYF